MNGLVSTKLSMEAFYGKAVCRQGERCRRLRRTRRWRLKRAAAVGGVMTGQAAFVSARADPAVDDQLAAGQVARLVGGQEENSVGDVLGDGQAAEGGEDSSQSATSRGTRFRALTFGTEKSKDAPSASSWGLPLPTQRQIVSWEREVAFQLDRYRVRRYSPAI